MLLVDDEREILEALTRVLRDEGYDLLTTTSPTEAMSILATGSVDLLVSDLRMPEMGGIELVRHVRKHHPNVVRILLTGHATLTSALEAINDGRVERFLLKPWDNDELRAQIRDVVLGIQRSKAIAPGALAAAPPPRHAALVAAELPPRLFETGVALMTGASEKQIAADLGLSLHTTHHYVKQLYRRFGVSSRAEYMAAMQREQDPESRK